MCKLANMAIIAQIKSCIMIFCCIILWKVKAWIWVWFKLKTLVLTSTSDCFGEGGSFLFGFFETESYYTDQDCLKPIVLLLLSSQYWAYSNKWLDPTFTHHFQPHLPWQAFYDSPNAFMYEQQSKYIIKGNGPLLKGLCHYKSCGLREYMPFFKSLHVPINHRDNQLFSKGPH